LNPAEVTFKTRKEFQNRANSMNSTVSLVFGQSFKWI